MALSPTSAAARPWLSPVPWGFALLATASSLAYGGNQAVNAWASTDLANLGDHPVEALMISPLLFGADPWACLRGIALVGTMLVFLVIQFGAMRAVALAAAGQVIGTLVSEGLLAARIAAGQADPALRAVLDVGPSYLIVSVLAAVATTGARRWHRCAAVVALAMRAPHLLNGLTTLAVTPVGHVTALSTGALLAWGLRSSDARHRRLQQVALGAAPLQSGGRTAGRVLSVIRPPARRRTAPVEACARSRAVGPRARPCTCGPCRTVTATRPLR